MLLTLITFSSLVAAEQQKLTRRIRDCRPAWSDAEQADDQGGGRDCELRAPRQPEEELCVGCFPSIVPWRQQSRSGMQSLGRISHQDTDSDVQSSKDFLMMLYGLLPQRSAMMPVELLRHVRSL